MPSRSVSYTHLGQEPHFIERREEGNKVTIVKGEGEERIVRTIERNALDRKSVV